MKVKDILSRKGSEIYSTTPETTVYDAISKMSKLNIGALLVMDGDFLAGIVSERDYRNKVILQGRTSRETRVVEIMTRDLITVKPDDRVQLCMQLMTENKVRHLPVLNGREVVGVISIGDVVKTVIDSQRGEINSLREYISAGGSYH